MRSRKQNLFIITILLLLVLRLSTAGGWPYQASAGAGAVEVYLPHVARISASYVSPTPTWTPLVTETPTAAPTPTSTATATPTVTPTLTDTTTPIPTFTVTPTPMVGTNVRVEPAQREESGCSTILEVHNPDPDDRVFVNVEGPGAFYGGWLEPDSRRTENLQDFTAFREFCGWVDVSGHIQIDYPGEGNAVIEVWVVSACGPCP